MYYTSHGNISKESLCRDTRVLERIKDYLKDQAVLDKAARRATQLCMRVKSLCSYCAHPRWKLLLSFKPVSCKFIYLNKSSMLKDHSVEEEIHVKFKSQRNQQVQSRSLWWVRWKKYPQPIKPLGRPTAKQFHKIQWHHHNLKWANKTPN